MAQVGIGTTSPSSSAQLEVQASDKGILFPRLSTAERDAIVNPAPWLFIFNTENRALEFYDPDYGWLNHTVASQAEFISLQITNNQSSYLLSSALPALTKPTIIKVIVAPGVTLDGGGAGATTGFRTGPASFYPDGSQLILENNGTIAGRGGNGGDGGNAGCPNPQRGGDGQDGGDAIEINLPTRIVNNGTVVAGGGGGGGGAASVAGCVLLCVGGLGGSAGAGGAGLPPGQPGVNGNGCGSEPNCSASPTQGTLLLGGSRATNASCGPSGGDGGDAGKGGDPGQGSSRPGGAPGAQGFRVRTNGYPLTYEENGSSQGIIN